MQTFRILHVEDDYDMSFLARKIVLQSVPTAEVVTVKAAEEALARLQVEKFDLVVTDLRLMGAMDGLGLIVALRQQCHAFPIMMLTSSDEVRQRAVDSGADDFLSTGDLVQMGRRVKHLLHRPRG